MTEALTIKSVIRNDMRRHGSSRRRIDTIMVFLLSVSVLSLFPHFYVNTALNTTTVRLLAPFMVIAIALPVLIKRIRIKRDIFVFGFAFWAALSILWGHSTYRVVVALAGIFGGVLWFTTFAYLLKSPDAISSLLKQVWWIAVVFTLLSIGTERFVEGLLDTSLVICLLPIGLSLRTVSGNRRHRLAYSIAIGVLVTATLFSSQRSGLAGVVLAFIVYYGLLATVRRQAHVIIISTLLIAVLVIFVPWAELLNALKLPILDRLERVSSLGLDFTTGRINLWDAALQMFYTHPVLGVGAGNFGILYYQYSAPVAHLDILGILIASPQLVDKYETLHTHNLVMSLLAEYGIIGLLLFVVLLWKAVRRLWRTISWYRGSREVAQMILASGVLASLLNVLLMGQFSGVGQVDRPYIWIVFGLAVLVGSMPSSQHLTLSESQNRSAA